MTQCTHVMKGYLTIKMFKAFLASTNNTASVEESPKSSLMVYIAVSLPASCPEKNLQLPKYQISLQVVWPC